MSASGVKYISPKKIRVRTPTPSMAGRLANYEFMVSSMARCLKEPFADRIKRLPIIRRRWRTSNTTAIREFVMVSLYDYENREHINGKWLADRITGSIYSVEGIGPPGSAMWLEPEKEPHKRKQDNARTPSKPMCI